MLTDQEKDFLKEVGSIGAANAATSLSKLIGAPVKIEIPLVAVFSKESIAEIVGGSEVIVAGIYNQLEGGLQGTLLHVFKENDALELAGLVRKQKPGEELAEMDRSALAEMCNILTCAYSNALSKMLEIEALPSIPKFVHGGAATAAAAAAAAAEAEDSILTEVTYEIGDKKVRGYLFTVLSKDSFEKMKKIAEKYVK